MIPRRRSARTYFLAGAGRTLDRLSCLVVRRRGMKSNYIRNLNRVERDWLFTDETAFDLEA